MELFWTIIKVAARTTLVVLAIGLILNFITLIPVPVWVDLSVASSFINKVYTICVHWIPGFSILWPIGITVLRAIVAYWVLRGILIATRIVFTITN